MLNINFDTYRQLEGLYLSANVPPVQDQVIEPPVGIAPPAKAAPPDCGTIMIVPPPAAAV